MYFQSAIGISYIRLIASIHEVVITRQSTRMHIRYKHGEGRIKYTVHGRIIVRRGERTKITCIDTDRVEPETRR